MSFQTLLTRLPVLAALFQVPWFVLLSILRIRMGGTSSLLIVKLIDLLIPLPAFAGFVLAMVLLCQSGGQGLWLWSGTLLCGLIVGLFIWILL